jgi:hypothetical protein
MPSLTTDIISLCTMKRGGRNDYNSSYVEESIIIRLFNATLGQSDRMYSKKSEFCFANSLGTVFSEHALLRLLDMTSS